MSGMGRDKILGRIERETGLRIWPRSSPNAWNLPIFTHSFSRCTASCLVREGFTAPRPFDADARRSDNNAC